jgi:DNA-binding NarL/FixJ family response regulator
MIHILIANPNPTMSKALCFLLQREMSSIIIMEVRNVADMIRALAATPPNILLLDWNLYGSPAPETCRLLQKAYPHLKVVLMSVNADDHFAAQEVGAGFINKDAEPDEWIASLRASFIDYASPQNIHKKLKWSN